MTRDTAPGPLAGEKQSEAKPSEPSAAEVESARLLANEARQRLRSSGLPDHELDMLAERFIAEDRGEDVEAFISWAVEQARSNT